MFWSWKVSTSQNTDSEIWYYDYQDVSDEKTSFNDVCLFFRTWIAEIVGDIWKKYYNFANRNSLHVDVTWEVAKTKYKLKRWFDWIFFWTADDDSWVKWKGWNQFNPANWEYFLTNINTRYELSWYDEDWFEPQKFSSFFTQEEIEVLKTLSAQKWEKARKEVDWIISVAKEKYKIYLKEQYNKLNLIEVTQSADELQVYSPWKWVEWVEFIRINDREKYIKEMKKTILKALKDFFKYWWTLDKGKLKQYYELWKISKLEIFEIIDRYLREEGSRILFALSDNGLRFEDLSYMQKRILVRWSVNNELWHDIEKLWMNWNDLIISFYINWKVENELFDMLLLPEVEDVEPPREIDFKWLWLWS